MRLLVLLLVAASLAGCASDDGSDPDATQTDTSTSTSGTGSSTSSSMTGTSTSTTTTSQPKRDPVTWQVEVRDNSFAPAQLTIQSGDTVRWVRVGSNPHTVTADRGEFHSGDCPSTDCFGPAFRQSFEWTSSDPVDVPYFCKVHGPGMSGEISVLERYDETP